MRLRLAAKEMCKVFNATLVTNVRVRGGCVGDVNCECGFLVVRRLIAQLDAFNGAAPTWSFIPALLSACSVSRHTPVTPS